MRLKDDVNFAVSTLARGSESCANLSGVMSVIIDDSDAAHLTADLESAVNSSEALESIGDLVWLYFKLVSNGDGGGAVEHIVAARHMQFKRAQGARCS